MSEQGTPAANAEAATRVLAAKSGLEYREAGAVTVDPRTLSLLPGVECRRLRAVPLSISSGSLVVGIDDASEEHRESVRELTGPGTRFVLLTERTLDALLTSRMFAPAPRVAGPAGYDESDRAVPEPQPASESEHRPAPPEPSAPTVEPLPPAAAVSPQPPLDLDRLAETIVAALEPRLQPAAPMHFPPPAPSLQPPPAPAAPGPDPVAQVDAAVAAWPALRSTMLGLDQELDAARRSLRELKESLAVAHAENDQHQRRIHALEAELTDNRALLDEARIRLLDAADILETRTPRLETPRELH
jgi:hypothetical protein